MNEFILSLISGAVGGIISGVAVYLIQRASDRKREQKRQHEFNRIGSTSNKYLDEDFLFNHLPVKYSIEKIKEELGNPDNFYDTFSRKISDVTDLSEQYEITLYEYKFINARILFSTLKDSSNVSSITIQNTDYKYPLKAILSPLSQEEMFPHFENAKIDEAICETVTKTFSERFVNWYYAAIQAKHFNREFKSYYFTYICFEIVETEDVNNFLGLAIDQICISTLSDIVPVIDFYE